MDFSHSYLQFKYTNKTNKFCQPDLGVPFFSRLQIMSGGQELEDIQEWSRLYAILLSAQGSRLNSDELSLTQPDPNVFAAKPASFTATTIANLNQTAGSASEKAAGLALLNGALTSQNPSLNPRGFNNSGRRRHRWHSGL